MCDLSFIDIPNPNTKRYSESALLPYVGPGRCAKPAASFMLENKICAWKDIQWSLEATGKILRGCFKKTLDLIENAWPEDHDHMAKLNCNCMIGLWAKSESNMYSVKSSTD